MPTKKKTVQKANSKPRAKNARASSASDRAEILSQTSQILSAAANGIVAVDLAGKIALANPAAADLLNRDASAMAGMPVDRAFVYGNGHPKAGEALPLMTQFVRGPYYMDHEVHLARSDGQSFEAVYSVATLKVGGEISGYVITFQDITERRRSEAELRIAAAVFDNNPEGLVVADSSQRVAKVNPAFEKLSGINAAKARGLSLADALLGGADASANVLESLEDREHAQWEQWCKNKKGKRYSARISVAVIRNDAAVPQQYVAIIADITQRKLDEEKIIYQANYDQLTNLPNRTLFMDRLTRRVLEGKRSKTSVGLMFVDLDGFKAVNDTLSHDAGDDLLKQAARRLEQCIREADTVARLGGDEFTVIMPLIDSLEAAGIVADRIIASLTQPFDLSGREGRISASIGISLLPAQASTASELLHNADVAMYHAKRSGKANFKFYSAELEATVSVPERAL